MTYIDMGFRPASKSKRSCGRYCSFRPITPNQSVDVLINGEEWEQVYGGTDVV